MGDLIRKFAVALILMVGVVGCSDNDNALKITGPEVSQGPGRVYPITQVYLVCAVEVGICQW
jgi:hypothetical protein